MSFRFTTLPQRVVALPEAPVSVSSGLEHSAAVTASGDLFVWGSLAAQLEEEERQNRLTKGLLKNDSLEKNVSTGVAERLRDEKRKGLATRGFSWLTLDDDAEAARLMVSPNNAEEGLAWFFEEKDKTQSEAGWLPVRLTPIQQTQLRGDRPPIPSSLALGGVRFKFVCCGPDYSAAVTEEGCLYTWGRNSSGVLGLGDTADRRLPTAVSAKFFAGARALNQTAGDARSAGRVACVACGNSHVIALSRDGNLFSWGSNAVAQSGVPGTRLLQTEPRQILLFDLAFLRERSPSLFKRVEMLERQTATAEDSAGRPRGDGGEEGSPEAERDFSRSKPRLCISRFREGVTLAVGAEELHSLADAAENSSQCALLEATRIVFSQIACGSLHSLALGRRRGAQGKTDSEVRETESSLFVWGCDSHNCLGLGGGASAEERRLFETPVALPQRFFQTQGRRQTELLKQIAAGGTVSAAVTTEGNIWLWGDLLSLVEKRFADS